MLPNAEEVDIDLGDPVFQWAPTLGGECYEWYWPPDLDKLCAEFQWAPTLGGECYSNNRNGIRCCCVRLSFNGHPPLGVNATRDPEDRLEVVYDSFQWAPALGGECYAPYYLGSRNAVIAFQWAPTLGGECYSEYRVSYLYGSSRFQWAPTLGGECYILRV